MLVNEIQEDMYLLIGETYESNSTLLIKGDQALLVDAMASRADAEKLQEFVERELKKDVRFVVCTHFFSDHLAALNLFPSAAVIAHEDYLITFNSELYRSKEEEAHFREPDILISDKMQLRWGRHTLDIFYNPGHTSSTLSIDIKEANLLLVGDTLVGNIVYLVYSTPQRFSFALERLKKRQRGHVISSHGKVRSSEAIGNAEHYLKRLAERTNKARASAPGGQSLLETPLESCLPEGVEATPFEKIFHQRNLRTIVERQLFTPVPGTNAYHI
jgi:glyoxylase-like metal-dependent hydrolase (beta-lactamase superfamily II)